MQAITVSQLSTYIRNVFDSEELLHNIPVVGEIFGVSTSQSVTYFSLKDDNSTLNCVCFYPAVSKSIVEGHKVVVTGSVNYYMKGGRLSFNVTKIEKQGQGKLYEEFLALKDKLQKDGLFDGLHKIKIPTEIKRIGVITSRDGAVLQDIKNVSWRRNPSVDLVLYPTKVQGNGAAEQIAKAIESMDRFANVDVIVVARGGGSLEDLWAYNTEVVARAAYACQKPIVSAVGHETDFTIIDFVADLRAPTPSAAAELLTPNLQSLKAEFKNLINRFLGTSSAFIREHETNLSHGLSRVFSALERICSLSRERTRAQIGRFVRAAEGYIAQNEYSLGLSSAKLEKLNPLAVLKQGYARIEQGGVISSKGALDQNKNFSVIFHDGKIEARVDKEEK